MSSTIQVDNIKDIGGNTIISSNGSGTFTSNLSSNVSSATGTLPIANGGTGAATLAGAGLQRPNVNPLIINGDCAVSQRSTSVTGITGSGYNTIDRFKVGFAMGTWTQTQESLTSGNAYTDGFSNALKMDCTTADASVGSSDRLALSYNIEGQDLQLLKKGTANAEPVTISFWVKATKTGTNILELYDNDNNRQISIAYTVSSSDTWEYKVVNFPADTTGVLGDDNGSSLAINWWMGAGSNFSSGTLSTSWSSVTDADRAVGQVNHADSTSNNFHITAVQLVVGTYTSSTIPPFQHESFGDSLYRCMRYYETQTGFQFFTFQSGTNVTNNAYVNCSVKKRANPTGSFSGSIINFFPNTGGGQGETNNATGMGASTGPDGHFFVGFETEANAPTTDGFHPIYADARNLIINWASEL